MDSDEGTVPQAEVVALEDRAYDNLRYIRSTLESAGSFTAVPGWGGVAMGLCGVGGAIIGAYQESFEGWLFVSVLTAVAAALAGGLGVLLKVQRTGASLAVGPGRKFVMGLSPALIAAIPITWVVAAAQEPALLVATWHLLYGAAVISAGTFSIRLIPLMGVCFMVFGGLAFFAPAAAAPLIMGLGFGGLHIIFGAIIALRHGG